MTRPDDRSRDSAGLLLAVEPSVSSLQRSCIDPKLSPPPWSLSFFIIIFYFFLLLTGHGNDDCHRSRPSLDADDPAGVISVVLHRANHLCCILN